jgi:hypothetical protein
MCAMTAASQMRSITGEIRYEHQYQDILSGGILSTALRQSPRFSLQTGGVILRPELATFDLRTALAWDLGTGKTRDQSVSTRQFSWDSYDLNVALLQYSPVKINASARDNLLKTRSDNGLAETFSTGVRRQEQRFNVSTYKLTALPSTTVGFDRTRTYSTTGDPFDQVVQRLSLGMSTANGSSAMSVSAGISRSHERVSGLRNTYGTVQFNANKDFTEDDQLDITADYDRYDDFATLGTTANFRGLAGEATRLFTSVFGRTSVSRITSSLYYGASQGVQITAGEHWQFGGTLSSRAGRDTRMTATGENRETTFDWAGNTSVQHSRETVLGMMQNAASVSYREQKLGEEHRGLSGSVSNGLSRTFGLYAFAIGHGLSGGIAMNGSRRYSVGNTGTFTFTAAYPSRLWLQTSANYSDERYSGDVGRFRNRRMLMARQGLTTPVVFLFPFSLSAGASVTWYFAGITGKAYGWYGSFTTGSFFVRGLAATYRYNRTYDPYFLREAVEQTAEFRYQWRSVFLELRLREYSILDRRREVWFSIGRPFVL